MMMQATSRSRGTAPVLAKFRRLGPVPPDLANLIANLSDIQTVRAGAEIVGERDPAPRPRFLVLGWAARVRWLPDGRRQLINFILPGDGIGICLRPSPLALSTTIALTAVQLAEAAAVQKAAVGADPRWSALRDLIHVSAGLEETLLLNQIVRLGRQTAYERICHLLLETRDRLVMAGMAEGDAFPMPLTQEVLADATGLSIVHVNRTLQQLRHGRLLDLQGGRVRLLDPTALVSIADYRQPIDAMRQLVP